MNEDARAIAYFWEPLATVASLVIALGCLALAVWLIHEFKNPHRDDYDRKHITPAEPSPGPESPDRPAKKGIDSRHSGR